MDTFVRLGQMAMDGLDWALDGLMSGDLVPMLVAVAAILVMRWAIGVR